MALKNLGCTNVTRPQIWNFDVALFLSLYYSGIPLMNEYNEYKNYVKFSLILGIR